ncbi:hypothetical protein OIV83_002036 [Microbotryomycetes sp. JL201]|nr:hypothetical protein OIV83_002036 [Microbotryomycetes sp. JL201]
MTARHAEGSDIQCTMKPERPTTRILGPALPQSSSESALAPPDARPAIDAPGSVPKRKGIKPFILRSSTQTSKEQSVAGQQGASAVPLQPVPGLSPGAAASGSHRHLARAKSVPGLLSNSAYMSVYGDENAPPVPPLPKTKFANKKKQRAPPSTPLAKPSTLRIATDDDRAADSEKRLQSPQGSPADPQEVERHKIQLKRSTTMARRIVANKADVGEPSAARKWLSAITGTNDGSNEGCDAASPERIGSLDDRKVLAHTETFIGLQDVTNGSNRVFSRGAAAKVPHRLSSLLAADLVPSEESSGSDSSATIVPGRLARSRTTRQIHSHALETPTRPSSVASEKSLGSNRSKSKDGRRKGRYGDLARPKSFDSRPRSQQIQDEEYSSMQEMLESSGFADVRVITPQAPIRSTRLGQLPSTAIAIEPPSTALAQALPSSIANSHHFSDTNCFGSPSSLAPPLSMQHKASMLSLRGLISLWRTEESADEAPEADEEQHEPPSADFDMSPDRKRELISNMQLWADQVSREVATLSTSPAANAVTALAHRGSLRSLTARSSIYGSSRPPSLRPSLSNVSVSSSTSQHSHRRRPSVRTLARETALRSLRHVVSDPSMGGATVTGLRTSVHGSPRLGGYQSFALTGIVPWGMTVDYDTWGQAAHFQDDGSSEVSRLSLTISPAPASTNFAWPATSNVRVEYDDLSDEQEKRLDASLKRMSKRLSVQTNFDGMTGGNKTSKSYDSLRRIDSIAGTRKACQQAVTNQSSKGTGGFWNTLKNKASGALSGLANTLSATVEHEPMPLDFQATLDRHRTSVDSTRPRLIRKAVSTQALKPKLSIEEFDWDEVVRMR